MAGVPHFSQGWLSDLPDPRDFTPASPEIRAALAKLPRRRSARSALPTAVDLREYCTPPQDQGPLRSTSPLAVLGMTTYFERRATGRFVEGSPLFLYRTARKLDGIAGDNGVGLRATLRALRRFGCPPERHWPYDATRFDAEPEPFAYGFQQEYAGLRYFRLDDRGMAGGDVLRRVKAFLAAGFVCICGAVPTMATAKDGDLPYPTKFDAPGGGAAFTVVGYDDRHRIRSTKGALIVRGTQGTNFGDGGYGRLPYRFVEEHLACDFWTLWNAEWAASGEFEQVVG